MATSLVDSLLEPVAEAIINTIKDIFSDTILQDDFGVFKAAAITVILPLAVATLLYLPSILAIAQTYKNYVPFIVFIVLGVILFGRIAWKGGLHPANNGTDSKEPTPQDDHGSTTPATKSTTIIFKPSPVPEEPETNTEPDLQEILPAVDSKLDQENVKQYPSELSKDVCKDGCKDDCEKYATFLFSNAKITESSNYNLKGYLEVFGLSINFIGKPTVPVIDEKFVPSVFRGEMMDVMNRRRNTEATSSLSVQDAVMKALVKLCHKLKQLGYG